MDVVAVLDQGFRAHWPEDSEKDCHCAQEPAAKDELYQSWATKQEDMASIKQAMDTLTKLDPTGQAQAVSYLKSKHDELEKAAAELHCTATEWEAGQEVSDPQEIHFLRFHNVKMLSL